MNITPFPTLRSKGQAELANRPEPQDTLNSAPIVQNSVMFNMQRFQNTTRRHKEVDPGGVPEHAKCLVHCHLSHVGYSSGGALADRLKMHGILFI
jgi:hypothetical protein